MNDDVFNALVNLMDTLKEREEYREETRGEDHQLRSPSHCHN